MLNILSIINNKSININCEYCGYTHSQEYSKIPFNKSFIICPVCSCVNNIPPKSEFIKALNNAIKSLTYTVIP